MTWEGGGKPKIVTNGDKGGRGVKKSHFCGDVIFERPPNNWQRHFTTFSDILGHFTTFYDILWHFTFLGGIFLKLHVLFSMCSSPLTWCTKNVRQHCCSHGFSPYLSGWTKILAVMVGTPNVRNMRTMPSCMSAFVTHCSHASMWVSVCIWLSECLYVVVQICVYVCVCVCVCLCVSMSGCVLGILLPLLKSSQTTFWSHSYSDKTDLT